MKIVVESEFMTTARKSRDFLTRFAWVSIAAAVATIILKTVAYLLTGSVGLLSDALESIVNLVGGIMALSMLTVAAQPEDDEHAYGHSKAEYFSSTVEGLLIIIAAISIAYTAVQRIISPRELEQIGWGLIVSTLASGINLAVALIILKAARQYDSITLKANANHLLTDVWTSAGVIVGVGAVALSGWNLLDPLIAIAVAINIIRTGVSILGQSVSGLMDSAWPADEQKNLNTILEPFSKKGVQFHAIRTRVAGARRFVSFHVLVPGHWTVDKGHHLLEEIEETIYRKIPNVNVITHLEPINDPASMNDLHLDRQVSEAPDSAPASQQTGNSKK